MSIHSSLGSSGSNTEGVRNVMKRHERLRLLIAQGRWAEDESVFGLQKIKPERRKAKKAAPKEAAAEAGTEAAAAPEAAAAAPAKPAKPAK